MKKKSENKQHAEMKIEALNIADLHEDPANVRRHPTRNLEAIRASLERFGQVRPILLDHKNLVRAGNGTLAAARTLGWTTIKAIRTNLIGIEAAAYSVVDNRCAELAGWDERALATMLGEFKADENFDEAITGFNPEEIERLIAEAADSTVGRPPSDFPEYDESLVTEHQCPKCGYEWSGKAK